ncbi:hypothetical protein ACMFWY_05780 [Roseiconus sp. JC912]
MKDKDLSRLTTRREWMRKMTLLGFSGASLSTMGADWPNLVPRVRVTKPPSYNCIPKHDYQHKSRSPSMFVPSQTAQIIGAQGNDDLIANALTGGRNQNTTASRKRFRPNRSLLTIDHCRVSSVVLDIERNGIWTLSLLAEQNFAELEANGELNPFSHLLRNQFHFHARLIASESSVGADARESDQITSQPASGSQVTAVISPKPFWVQRQQPRQMRWQTYDKQIALAFEQSAAVQFEFFYQLDPLSAAGKTVRRLEDV